VLSSKNIGIVPSNSKVILTLYLNMLQLLVASFAILATLTQGNLLNPEKRQSLAESHPLAKRDCEKSTYKVWSKED
jgi:hypothetical protein